MSSPHASIWPLVNLTAVPTSGCPICRDLSKRKPLLHFLFRPQNKGFLMLYWYDLCDQRSPTQMYRTHKLLTQTIPKSYFRLLVFFSSRVWNIMMPSNYFLYVQQQQIYCQSSTTPTFKQSTHRDRKMTNHPQTSTDAESVFHASA